MKPFATFAEVRRWAYNRVKGDYSVVFTDNRKVTFFPAPTTDNKILCNSDFAEVTVR